MRGRKPKMFTCDLPKLTMAPKPPRTLSLSEKRVWRDLCRQLMAAQVLAKLDLSLVERVVFLQNVVLTCESKLRAEGLVDQQTGYARPEVAIHKNAVTTLARLYSELGMTPLARTRLPTSTAPGADAMDEFLMPKAGAHA